ncbi:MAG: MIP family channel protein [Clostridia bacterium]|nr:MIP family channel protein [Clostridia bacterium]
MNKELFKKMTCEFIGTAVLVLFGCGTAVFANCSVDNPGGYALTALAFGLSIIAMAYVIGNVSGCHVNPAVSFNMAIRKVITWKDFVFYTIAQILGAFAGSGLLYAFVSMNDQFEKVEHLGENGFGHIGMWGAFLAEVILTFVFIYLINGVTSDHTKSNCAGLMIGLTLTFVHILGIPLTGTSVNPARSLAPAVLLGGDALTQVWVFIVAPLIGAAIAAFAFKFLNEEKK